MSVAESTVECEPVHAEAAPPKVIEVLPTSAFKKLGVQKISNFKLEKESAPQTQLVPNTQAPAVAIEALPKTVSLDISEQQVTAMEQNLAMLQNEVSLFREEKGWVVRFHHESNLMARLGVKDNDLIRFHQFEELKADPNQQQLVGRLQEVLSALER